MKQRKKGEHYIPNKSYLECFTDKTCFDGSMLWVYENPKAFFNENCILSVKNISPKNFCKENNFYESPIFPVNAVEDELAKIEENYQLVLENKILKKIELSKDEKLAISRYLSALEMRTPVNKRNNDNFLNEIIGRMKLLEETHKMNSPSKNRIEAEELLLHNSAFMISLATAIDFNRFGPCDFQILYINPSSADSFFITSDFPVSLISFTSMNSFYPPMPLDFSSEIITPITPQMAIFANNIGQNGYREINYNFVEEINQRVIHRANKYIISDRELDGIFFERIRIHFPQSLILHNLLDSFGKTKKKI